MKFGQKEFKTGEWVVNLLATLFLIFFNFYLLHTDLVVYVYYS